jgi:hypothetical protein
MRITLGNQPNLKRFFNHNRIFRLLAVPFSHLYNSTALESYS